MWFSYIKDTLHVLVDWIKGKIFYNIRIYARYDNDKKDGAFRTANSGPVAIVVQGPLIKEFGFTVETLKLYRRNFGDLILVLSTWEDSKLDEALMHRLNVHIVKNVRPDFAGMANINLQIVSSRRGIEAARRLGAQYVLKTRTDQRIYQPSLIAYLFSLIKMFPLSGVLKQKCRIVSISLSTFKYRMYGVSDMFLFGHIDDMSTYWSVPLDDRDFKPSKEKLRMLTWREYANWCTAEVYLCTQYILSLGREPKYTLADSFDVLCNHFVIIDHEAINIYWHKYSIRSDRYSSFDLANIQFSFNDWLFLYTMQERLIVDENILDGPILGSEENN